MAMSRRLVPGVVLFLGGALVGCAAPDHGDGRTARADEQTTQARGALTTSLFQPYVAYATGSSAEAVAIGDLDGDGRNDVAVLTSVRPDPANDYMVHVFLQDVDGSLKPRIRYAVGASGNSIDVGDVNGDGRADLVVGLGGGGASPQIGVLLQNASGTLDAMLSFPTVNSSQVRVGDFNGDGRLDVAGASSTGVDVLLQTDGGTLASPVTYAVQTGGLDELDAGDVDGDGRTDLLVMSGQGFGPNVMVLLQGPDGTLGTPVPYSAGTQILTHGIAVGDTNGDGRSDVVVTTGANRPDTTIARFLQNAQGTLDPAVSYPSWDSPSAIVLADVDADGRKDALVSHNNRLGVYRQFPSGDFVNEEFYSVPAANRSRPQVLAAGDINGDGRLDAVLTDTNNGLIVLRQVQDTPLALAVSSPAGGPYYTGLPLTIRWSAGDTVALAGFDVSVSFDGGATYAPIAGCTGLPATATQCAWTPTGPAASGVRVRVTARDAGGQTAFAESTFELRTAAIFMSLGIPSNSLAYVGAVTSINWSHNLPSSGTLRIELSRDGGASYETVADALPIGAGGGNFQWTITGPTTTNARIRLTANGSVPASATSSTFAIATPPAMQVGVGLTGGVAYTSALSIGWTPIAGVNTVRIELSRDGGATFQTLAASYTYVEAVFNTSVAGPSAADARVRVTALGAIPSSGISPSFTLAEPALSVTSPVGGSTAYAGNAAPIIWSTNLPASSPVRIELSRDGGATYQVLAASAPNTGSFAWTAAGPDTAAGRVRLTVTGPGSTVATSGTFAIVTPSLAVTSPAAGAKLFSSASIAITWSSNLPASASALIELSRDGGSTYQALATSAPNSGSFAWVVTQPTTMFGRVRVTLSGPVSIAASSGTFEITVPVMTGPALSASLYVGAPTEITWTTNLPPSSPVLVELSRNGGGSFETLAAAAPNTGSFSWVVTGPDSQAVIARVTVTSPVAISRTSATRAIVTPSLTVTGSPTGGLIGTPMAITWSTNMPASSPVLVELSRDGGVTFETLAAAAPNTGSFAWIATGPETGAARVRVTATNPVAASGTSGPFAIVAPSLVVTGPSAVTAYAGTSLAITWATNMPPSSPVLVELSRDGGLTFETLAAAAPNTGSFAWTVSGPDSSAVVARVTMTDPVAVSSTGAGFAIVSPSLTVTGPAAGMQAQAGTPVTITWTDNLPAADPVSIELSRDGGATFASLATATNTGSFVWTASGPATANAVVRVTAGGAVSASNIGPSFAIVMPTVTVTSPAAGDSWAIGTARTISWSSNLLAGTTVAVALSRDGGATWTTLASASPATGSLAWTATSPATSNAIVRVSANGSIPAVGTSGAFSIGNPALAVTSPAAGASWTIGTAQTITWTSNLLPTATVKIQLSRNGGSTWTALASSAPNTGSFAWTVTGGATTTAIVKLSANGFSATAVSGTFSIVAASVTVTAPNTAVTWTIGSVQAITWTHNVGADAQFMIEVSRSGTWSVIASAVPGGGATTGSYQWTVTGPKTTNAKVRVTWTGGTAKDTSDVAFKIN